MTKILIAALALCLARPALATDSWGSEAAHFGGGILVGGAATWAADQWWPEDRLLFGIGTGIVFAWTAEGIDVASGNKFSWLDAVSSVAGATLGAFATDRWFLKPVVTHDRADSTRFGPQADIRF